MTSPARKLMLMLTLPVAVTAILVLGWREPVPGKAVARYGYEHECGLLVRDALSPLMNGTLNQSMLSTAAEKTIVEMKNQLGGDYQCVHAVSAAQHAASRMGMAL